MSTLRGPPLHTQPSFSASGPAGDGFGSALLPGEADGHRTHPAQTFLLRRPVGCVSGESTGVCPTSRRAQCRRQGMHELEEPFRVLQLKSTVEIKL